MGSVLNKLIRHLLIQSQQWKQQNNMRRNYNNVINVILVSLLLILNRFHTLLIVDLEQANVSWGHTTKRESQLKSLVMIRMNEIFPCLACYGQKLNFLVRKSRQR